MIRTYLLPMVQHSNGRFTSTHPRYCSSQRQVQLGIPNPEAIVKATDSWRVEPMVDGRVILVAEVTRAQHEALAAKRDVEVLD